MHIQAGQCGNQIGAKVFCLVNYFNELILITFNLSVLFFALSTCKCSILHNLYDCALTDMNAVIFRCMLLRYNIILATVNKTHSSFNFKAIKIISFISIVWSKVYCRTF